ncbi:CMGC SRPK kinase [Fusarium napiforme]|uniref:CMGC SRPK kinase n=1 Tax=Fusarium napiforme TaxID=42672 RepID=A0A8H5N7C6_9HYPO|nr:CMGC SRPK kinase [Fusarium napiforme]
MNGTQSPDAQKATIANTNGSNSNNSSLAAKKRKKDLKPIITMEGTNQPAGYLYIHLVRILPAFCFVATASPYTTLILGNFSVAHCFDIPLETAGLTDRMARSQNPQGAAGPMSPTTLIQPNCSSYISYQLLLRL